MSAPEISESADERSGPRAERIAKLAKKLGIELPPFDGPLVAFQPDGHRSREDPVFLGGDLHAVHPTVDGRATGSKRDTSLDSAIVTLADHEHEMLDLAAIEGIWCTPIAGERLATTPYLALTDSEGRIRAWLLLPPPRLMIGIARFWLPSILPPDDPRSRG